MKSFTKLALLVAAAVLVSLPAFAAPVLKGTTIIRAEPAQTTASTKLLKVQTAAGADVLTADLEGDLVCRNLTVSGTFTLPATDFASGMSINTDKAVFASTGNLNIGPDKLTVAASSGNTVVAGTLTSTGVLAANAGITVDSTAFTVADTSGNVATTGTLTAGGLSSLNGGIAVDATFTVHGTTGAIAATGTLTQGAAISGTTLATIKGIMTYTSAATDVANIVANSQVATDIALTGVAANDLVVLVGAGSAFDSGVHCFARAKTDAITLVCDNITAGAIDPANKTYSFVIIDVT